MKRNIFLYCIFVCCLVLVLYGCISVSTSPSPRFYMLSPLDREQITQNFDITSGAIITVGPVKIPEYQNRPQIVTQNKNKMVTFSQLDRWGELPDMGFERLIFQNLIYMLPAATLKMFPYNYAIAPGYQITADVIQLENQLDKDMFMLVEWSLIDLNSRKILVTKRLELREPINPHNYSGLTQALNKAIASLSYEIAGTIAPEVTQNEIKNSKLQSK